MKNQAGPAQDPWPPQPSRSGPGPLAPQAKPATQAKVEWVNRQYNRQFNRQLFTKWTFEKWHFELKK